MQEPLSSYPSVLALQGSPRRGGNTDIILDRVLEVIRENNVDAEKIYVRDLNISPCLEINACLKTGRCAIDDDMTGLYDRLTKARVVILATPIFFYGPSASLKMVIDRCQALWARKHILGRSTGSPRGQGYVLAAAATKGARLFDGLMLTSRYFFDVLDLAPSGELLVRSVDDAGDVDARPDVLVEAADLGLEIVGHVNKHLF
jgi:NAD(P)H-dependent FMN reductase